jgi:hypothetical protein
MTTNALRAMTRSDGFGFMTTVLFAGDRMYQPCSAVGLATADHPRRHARKATGV